MPTLGPGSPGRERRGFLLQLTPFLRGFCYLAVALLVRRKHVDLSNAINAMSDPAIPTRDAMIMWRNMWRQPNLLTPEERG
jgi:hypothetical protein